VECVLGREGLGADAAVGGFEVADACAVGVDAGVLDFDVGDAGLFTGVHQGERAADAGVVLLGQGHDLEVHVREPAHGQEVFQLAVEDVLSAVGPAQQCLVHDEAGDEHGEPIGYAYAAALQPGARWWMYQLDPLPEDFTEENGHRTLALNQIMVRRPWRKKGIAHRIHEELLSGRTEERVTLLVDPRNTGVKRLYEEWGYEHIGDQKPFPDSPLYATMVRQLKAPVRPDPAGPTGRGGRRNGRLVGGGAAVPGRLSG